MKSRNALAVLTTVILPLFGLSLFGLPSAERFAEYVSETGNDAVARLEQKVNSGEVTLKFDEKWGYLPSILKELRIPASSQSLVFSKTSFQLDKIAPWSPRAIYFNDDVYVGWVPHGDIVEFAAVDPSLGAVFYTLDQQAEGKPKFQKQSSNCLQCHDSKMNTGGVPGFVVQSLYTDRLGYPLPTPDNPVSSDRTPFRNRFGGWYVTGTHGDQVHRGNVVPAKEAREIRNIDIYINQLDLAATGNVTDLSKLFNNAPYLSKGSDIAALMLLTHQTHLHNLMTLANFDAVDGRNSKSEALVRALLFQGEAKFTAPVRGSAEFAADFSSLGPRDHKGRSLRDFDLEHRLFKYPLSYLIYSDGFNGLQEDVKKYVSRRLTEILTGKDNSPEFAYLTTADREAILEILRDTKPGFLEPGITNTVNGDR